MRFAGRFRSSGRKGLGVLPLDAKSLRPEGLSYSLSLGFFCGGFHALEFFAGLEADGFAGRDVDFFAGAGVAADTGFAGLDTENTEAAELDALAAAESLLERLEDGFHRLFGLGAADHGFGDHRVDDIEFNHAASGTLANARR